MLSAIRPRDLSTYYMQNYSYRSYPYAYNDAKHVLLHGTYY